MILHAACEISEVWLRCHFSIQDMKAGIIGPVDT